MKRMLPGILLTVGVLALMWPVVSVRASFIEPRQQAEDIRQFEAKVLKLAETYTPDQLDMWKQELARRNELRSKLLKLKHERNMQMKLNEQKLEARNQRESNVEKMTDKDKRDDASRKHHAWSERRKQWKEEGRKLRSQLDEAVKAEDRERIVAALNALLDRLVEGNEMLDRRLQELQANMP
mgnify:CR=1 FL=1|jgi:hypothetical protein